MNTTPKENEIKYIREALNQFNKEIVGDDGHTPLNIIEYDENGNIIGGILGGTYWVGCMWIFYGYTKTTAKKALDLISYIKPRKKLFVEGVTMPTLTQ